MSGKRQDGVRVLADLLGRCRVNGETGCAVWHRPDDKRTWVSAGVLTERAAVMRPARAAWLLDGRKLQPGQEVHRKFASCCEGCILPAHGVAMLKREAGAMYAKDRRLAATPDRIAINLAAALRRAVPPEMVRRIEGMLSDGQRLVDIYAACGVTRQVVNRVRKGTHPHSTGRQKLVRGASIFTMGVEA